MKKTVRAKVFAKVNIGLSIGPPSLDGYHPIASIFQSINVFDTLIVSAGEAEGGIAVRGEFDCPIQETTVYKAASAFMAGFGIHRALEIVVEKGIPVKSGLGGGSADAAGTILALDKLFGVSRDLRRLEEMGSHLGADVPYFFHGGAAFVQGRGERVTPIAPRTDFGLVLVYPGFGISTKEAFARLDGTRARRGSEIRGPSSSTEESAGEGQGPRAGASLLSSLEAFDAEYRLEPSAWRFANDFSEIAGDQFPLYKKIGEAFGRTDALFQSLTGSGSCWYGIYKSMERAEEAASKMRKNLSGFEAALGGGKAGLEAVEPLDTSIILRYN